MSALPQALQGAAAPAAAGPSSALTTIAGAGESIAGIIAGPGQASAVVSVISGLSSGAQYLGGILKAADAAGASSPGLAASPAGLAPQVPAPGSAGRGAVDSAVSAGIGSSGVVGTLSVPPSWAAATPTVRLAATVLGGTDAAAAPAVTAAYAGSAVSQLALAGGALGPSVPRAISATAIRDGRPGSDRDGRTPDKLRRVLAELSQKPESVQHWHIDRAHLESLLDQLSKKPGIHAVHLSAGDKPKAAPPE